ncbi:YceI family protein [Chryseolinea lacunae]|uniref:YceI family protein n=1 Tax=Chryseolinea lacunae TaxID=2801331 RepID=A0ABS1KMZ1_9BACT|nr:YceI family protein [Chryseolinea lacunae]MBL0740622.1 YceI family protein [Chryseolinea lacunae]
MKNTTAKIERAQSTIEWVGKKVTGAHNGTIDIKEGELVFSDNTLTGGHFVIDITSIKILDIEDPATNAQFAGHLDSDDFFSTQKFPEATFEITSVKGNHVVGNLTIKGITHLIGFEAAIDFKNETATATAKIIVDRTKYDMKFRSSNFFANLGDTLIYNDFELNVSITARVATKNSSVLA